MCEPESRPQASTGEQTLTQSNPRAEEHLRAVTIGELKPLSGPIVLVDYNPIWPDLFAYEAQRIRKTLGHLALRIEHVGSTSVSGLAAKPIIDILLVVADSSNEPAYVPPMASAGYVLRIREPDWHEHRMFKGPDTDINLHVFSLGCPEIERLLLFRDWLRRNAADCDRYACTKQALALQVWKFTQDYADAKTAIVEEIIARAHSTPPPGM